MWFFFSFKPITCVFDSPSVRSVRPPGSSHHLHLRTLINCHDHTKYPAGTTLTYTIYMVLGFWPFGCIVSILLFCSNKFQHIFRHDTITRRELSPSDPTDLKCLHLVHISWADTTDLDTLYDYSVYIYVFFCCYIIYLINWFYLFLGTKGFYIFLNVFKTRFIMATPVKP